jgi:predicted HAD superfamily Cof-like phosphohydrolase
MKFQMTASYSDDKSQSIVADNLILKHIANSVIQKQVFDDDCSCSVSKFRVLLNTCFGSVLELLVYCNQLHNKIWKKEMIIPKA